MTQVRAQRDQHGLRRADPILPVRTASRIRGCRFRTKAEAEEAEKSLLTKAADAVKDAVSR